MTVSNLYREEVLEHAKHPRNFGQLETYDVKHRESNPLCGDDIELALKFDDSDRVSAVAFSGEGCIISKAAASLLTEFIKGKRRSELTEYSKEDHLRLFNAPLTPSREQCALLSFAALHNGLKRSA